MRFFKRPFHFAVISVDWDIRHTYYTASIIVGFHYIIISVVPFIVCKGFFFFNLASAHLSLYFWFSFHSNWMRIKKKMKKIDEKRKNLPCIRSMYIIPSDDDIMDCNRQILVKKFCAKSQIICINRTPLQSFIQIIIYWLRHCFYSNRKLALFVVAKAIRIKTQCSVR